jgi:hypothetical protein
VAYTSACIGQARSSYDDGVVSYVNPLAAALGLRAGERLLGQLHMLLPMLG